MIRDTSEGVVFSVKVTPKAKKNTIGEWMEETLKVTIKAPPEQGKANDELMRFFAQLLGVTIHKITLLAGATSRLKTLRIDQMTKEEFLIRLQSSKT